MFSAFTIKYDKKFSCHVNGVLGYQNRHVYRFFSQFNSYKMVRDLLNPSGRVMAKDIMERYFPRVRPDIFLSHSHNDFEIVCNFADYLWEKFGLVTFIDSVFWGSIRDLKTEMRDAYSELRYRTDWIEHIHVFLLSALAKIMDSSSCAFFFATPHSLEIEDGIAVTNSPWIYEELLTARLLRRRYRTDFGREKIYGPLFESYITEEDERRFVGFKRY